MSLAGKLQAAAAAVPTEARAAIVAVERAKVIIARASEASLAMQPAVFAQVIGQLSCALENLPEILGHAAALHIPRRTNRAPPQRMFCSPYPIASLVGRRKRPPNWRKAGSKLNENFIRASNAVMARKAFGLTGCLPAFYWAKPPGRRHSFSPLENNSK